jgi:NitT/TauT family transport system substrate-binding protein
MHFRNSTNQRSKSRSPKFRFVATGALMFLVALAGCRGGSAPTQSGAQPGQQVIRIGYFPNITHSQALVGRQQHAFENVLGPRVHVQWSVFNAGPSAIEALFANAVDITYIGPSPTINGYVQSHGQALRVIAGATSGGAGLVVRNGANINSPQDFHHKRIGTPQLGNTQDVALRAWLKSQDLKTTDKGGDVQVAPLPNPDQLTLFQRGSLDAAWAPEPWTTRLILEGNGHLFLDERTLWPDGKFAGALVVVRTQFLQQHPDLVKLFLRTHVELTDWINAHPDQAKLLLNKQIAADTGKALAPAVIDQAWTRLQPTYDPLRDSLARSAQESFDAGSLKAVPDLGNLYDLTLLNQVLTEQKKKVIP